MIQIPWQAFPVLVGLCAFGGWLLRLMFRAELAEFRVSIMKELNGKYMNAEIAQQRLEVLAEEMKTTRHNLRNEIHVLLNIAYAKKEIEIGHPH